MTSTVILAVALVVLSGCASAPLTGPTQAPPVHVQEDYATVHEGARILEFTSRSTAKCGVSFVAHVNATPPRMVWALVRVPTADDLFLELRGIFTTRSGIQVAGSMPFGQPSGPLGNYTSDVQFEARRGATYLLMFDGLRPHDWDPSEPNLQVRWACEKGSLTLTGMGHEVATMFPGSPNATLHIDEPTRTVAGDVEAKTERIMTSENVRLLYGAVGNRAGVIHVTREGAREAIPMQSIQILSYDGGPGTWGIEESGVSLDASRWAFIVGTEPLGGQE